MINISKSTFSNNFKQFFETKYGYVIHNRYYDKNFNFVCEIENLPYIPAPYQSGINSIPLAFTRWNDGRIGGFHNSLGKNNYVQDKNDKNIFYYATTIYYNEGSYDGWMNYMAVYKFYESETEFKYLDYTGLMSDAYYLYSPQEIFYQDDKYIYVTVYSNYWDTNYNRPSITAHNMKIVRYDKINFNNNNGRTVMYDSGADSTGGVMKKVFEDDKRIILIAKSTYHIQNVRIFEFNKTSGSVTYTDRSTNTTTYGETRICIYRDVIYSKENNTLKIYVLHEEGINSTTAFTTKLGVITYSLEAKSTSYKTIDIDSNGIKVPKYPQIAGSTSTTSWFTNRCVYDFFLTKANNGEDIINIAMYNVNLINYTNLIYGSSGTTDAFGIYSFKQDSENPDLIKLTNRVIYNLPSAAQVMGILVSEDRKKCITASKDGVVEYFIFDEEKQGFKSLKTIQGKKKSVTFEESTNRLFFINENDEIEYLALNNSADINIKFEKREVNYSGEEVSNKLLIESKNFVNELVSSKIEINLKGNAKFTENGTKTITVDTITTGTTEVPITVTGYGKIDLEMFLIE